MDPEDRPPAPPDADRPRVLHLSRLAIDLRPLRYRDFRRLWLGQAVSLFGSWITFVAIPFQVYDLTGSTLAVGLIALCELVPLLTLSIVSGGIACIGTVVLLAALPQLLRYDARNPTR
jgi:hypothetical protein